MSTMYMRKHCNHQMKPYLLTRVIYNCHSQNNLKIHFLFLNLSTFLTYQTMCMAARRHIQVTRHITFAMVWFMYINLKSGMVQFDFTSLLFCSTTNCNKTCKQLTSITIKLLQTS